MANTPNMIRAQARKKRTRLAREAADKVEAAKLRISVDELHRRRHLAALPFMTRCSSKPVHVPAGPPPRDEVFSFSPSRSRR